MRKLTSALFFAGLTFSASSAFAQLERFGDKGTVAFSADRMFGFYKAAYSAELPNGDNVCDQNNVDCDATGFGFGMSAGFDNYGFPYNYPRLGFDYFVIDKLSIGGSIGYASISNDQAGGEAFLFNPRVGYFLGLGSVVGFWPRGGFTYHSLDPDGPASQHGFGLTLEAMFAVAPVEHFAFMFGPTVDVDFTGSEVCGNNSDCKYRQRSFGIQVGLMGWL